ncbi:hypothetical protein K8089_12095 [Aequorivita sp. F47161]|uniref:Uncharacterized protein n=1 Tax=Aequorivita vitellina TaxID=2874475 RepID=A0A9X1UAM7_9FLAO|nr:hypothetical protein [Aequorivita vitellina]MCG2419766.1 hypothetical protein [Aequorivita vitellina]
MDLFERIRRPTPRFFRRLRNIGIGLTAIGGAIIANAIYLPSILIKIAGYFIVAGTVASVVSQTVINDTDDDDPPPDYMMPPGPNPLLDVNR